MFVLSLLLSATIAHAQTPQDKINCQNSSIQRDSFVSAATKKQNLELCLATKKGAQDAATLRSQIATLRDTEASCFKDERGVLGRVFNSAQRSPSSADVERCDKERKDKEAKLASLEENQKLQEQQLKTAEATYTAQSEATQMTAEQRAKTDSLVNSEFDSFKISILSSRLQATDAALKLTKMATALDNSAMGLYLRERMAGMLNSDVMCAAVKECPKPRKVKGSDLNSVFNSKMSTGVNAEREVVSSAPASAAPATPAVKTSK